MEIVLQTRDSRSMMNTLGQLKPEQCGQDQNLASSALAAQNKKSFKGAMIAAENQSVKGLITEKAVNKASEKQLDNQGNTLYATEAPAFSSQHLANKSTLPDISVNAPTAKRVAPCSESLNQPMAKRSLPSQVQLPLGGVHKESTIVENQGRPSFAQCALMAAPPYNPNLSLAQNANMMNSVLLNQSNAAGVGILGAPPPLPGTFRTKALRNEKKQKRITSRWDMPTTGGGLIQGPQGSTTYSPGAATWKRFNNPGNIPLSPCRSDANSAVENSYDHDPWPQHTPDASHSQSTQDSRLGAFSPPQTARDYYVTPSNQAGYFFGTRQENMDTQMEEQQDQQQQGGTKQNQIAAVNESEQTKAEAPALMAPRAP